MLAADKGGLGNGDSTGALEPSFVSSLLPSLPPSTRMVGGRGKAATSVEKTAASSAVSDSASEVKEASEVVVEVETERGRVEDVRRLETLCWWTAAEQEAAGKAAGERFEPGPLVLPASTFAPSLPSPASCVLVGAAASGFRNVPALPNLRAPRTHSALSLSRSRALLCGLAAWSTSPDRWTCSIRRARPLWRGEEEERRRRSGGAGANTRVGREESETGRSLPLNVSGRVTRSSRRVAERASEPRCASPVGACTGSGRDEMKEQREAQASSGACGRRWWARENKSPGEWLRPSFATLERGRASRRS